MTTQDTGFAQDELQQLFRTARESETDLTDDNFTKVVLNQLPAKSQRVNKQHWLPDLIGMLIAVVAISLLVEPTQVLHALVTSLPSSIVISSMNVLLVAITMFGAALAGWWVVENGA